jgi:hypothetical protein
MKTTQKEYFSKLDEFDALKETKKNLLDRDILEYTKEESIAYGKEIKEVDEKIKQINELYFDKVDKRLISYNIGSKSYIDENAIKIGNYYFLRYNRKSGKMTKTRGYWNIKEHNNMSREEICRRQHLEVWG